MTSDIKYPEEINRDNRQALLDKLLKLQAKKRRKNTISTHGHAKDNPNSGNSASQNQHVTNHDS